MSLKQVENNPNSILLSNDENIAEEESPCITISNENAKVKTETLKDYDNNIEDTSKEKEGFNNITDIENMIVKDEKDIQKNDNIDAVVNSSVCNDVSDMESKCNSNLNMFHNIETRNCSIIETNVLEDKFKNTSELNTTKLFNASETKDINIIKDNIEEDPIDPQSMVFKIEDNELSSIKVDGKVFPRETVLQNLTEDLLAFIEIQVDEHPKELKRSVDTTNAYNIKENRTSETIECLKEFDKVLSEVQQNNNSSTDLESEEIDEFLSKNLNLELEISETILNDPINFESSLNGDLNCAPNNHNKYPTPEYIFLNKTTNFGREKDGIGNSIPFKTESVNVKEMDDIKYSPESIEKGEDYNVNQSKSSMKEKTLNSTPKTVKLNKLSPEAAIDLKNAVAHLEICPTISFKSIKGTKTTDTFGYRNRKNVINIDETIMSENNKIKTERLSRAKSYENIKSSKAKCGSNNVKNIEHIAHVIKSSLKDIGTFELRNCNTTLKTCKKITKKKKIFQNKNNCKGNTFFTENFKVGLEHNKNLNIPKTVNNTIKNNKDSCVVVDTISISSDEHLDTVTIDSSDNELMVTNKIENEDDDCGYHSSDFEFITEEEAKMDGFIINFNPERHCSLDKAAQCSAKTEYVSKVSKWEIDPYGPGTSNDPGSSNGPGPSYDPGQLYQGPDDSSDDDYVVPDDNAMVSMFQNLPALPMSEIHFLENKSLHTRVPMLVQYEGVGFDLSLATMAHSDDDDDYSDEVQANLNRILDMYPGENGRKTRTLRPRR